MTILLRVLGLRLELTPMCHMYVCVRNLNVRGSTTRFYNASRKPCTDRIDRRMSCFATREQQLHCLLY